MSIGIATMPNAGQTVEALLHAADERLYAGKRAGGNRVIGAGLS
ncbi:MAG: diguanylate cyclase [Vicinamibacterales bacterium]